MKSKSSYLFGALALGLVAMIIWTASLAAQVVPTPDGITIEAPSDFDNRPPTAAAADEPEPAPQRQPFAPNGPEFRPARGVTRYVDPVTGYPLTGSGGVYETFVTPLDAKTQELVSAYLSKQGEINQLVKKYGEATDENAKNSLRDEIVKATTAQFDLRQQARAREIEQLKKRLADVETNVQQRNELKDKIVEKRVADILREPDQLGWEPLAPSPGTVTAPAIGVNPLHYSSGQVGPIIPAPTVRYVPRTETRIVREIVVDSEGKQTVIERPTAVTVYAPVEGEQGNKPSAGVQSPLDDHSPHSTLQSTATLPAGGQFRPIQITPSTMYMTVAEAEARVRIAQQRRDLLLKQSRVVNPDEMQPLDAELALARVMLSRAQAEYDGRAKLLELDVRRAEVTYEQEVASLKETDRVVKAVPNAITESQVTAQKAAVEQARIAWERAKTLLEIHQKSNAPQ